MASYLKLDFKSNPEVERKAKELIHNKLEEVLEEEPMEEIAT